MMICSALLLFPEARAWALGLRDRRRRDAAGRRRPGRHRQSRPAGRIRNTRKLLLTAALIMSVCSSAAHRDDAADSGRGVPRAARHGRALAYLAHEYLGDVFGTIYDVSTIAILWFAGASAMAGLLNLVPRYLPRYGMAPEWARATRPLVVMFTAITFVVTIIFKADVEAQGGAYATGVLVLMTSARWRSPSCSWKHRRRRRARLRG